MDHNGLDLLAHWISTDQEQRRSLDGYGRLDRSSASSSYMAQSPRMSTSFGLSRMLSIQPSSNHRRSEDSSAPFSQSVPFTRNSVPFSRAWSLERSSSTAAESNQVNLEDMEAMVQGYTLMSSQSTPPISVPNAANKNKNKNNNYNPPPSPVVGRSVAASMGDIEVYWKSMYLE